MPRRRLNPITTFGLPFYGGGLIPTAGQEWFVDPNASLFEPAKRFGDGKSIDRPFETLAEALSACNTGDVIYITGNIREENLICSNLKFDVHIVGLGGQHHPDQPDSTYHPGAAMIRPPASPTAATPLLVVRGRGWQFHNIAFDCPVDAAAIQLNANASSGTSEYDAGHAVIRNCLFTSGYRGIQDVGGVINVQVRDCIFRIISESGGAAIVNTSTSVRLPQYWRIRDCFFGGNAASGGNETHIDAPASGWEIKGNTFGVVEGSGLYIDLTGGDDNIVVDNYFTGSYSTDDYVAGTNDMWVGNYSIDTAEAEVEASGETNTVPAS